MSEKQTFDIDAELTEQQLKEFVEFASAELIEMEERKNMTSENPPIDPDRHRMGDTTQLDRIESKLDRVLAAMEMGE